MNNYARLYQPFLLRVLHGMVGLFSILAMITGFWIYDVYDGRWGRINLTLVPEIQDIHGAFGILSFVVFPAFVIYTFRKGQKRLIQPNFLKSIMQSSRRSWWLNTHQIINTLILLPLTLALFSGQMMDGSWLPNRELEHFWYSVHIASWLVLFFSIMLHIILSIKVGGLPLLFSVLNWQFTAKDSPIHWLHHINRWYHNICLGSISRWWTSSGFYHYMEASILASLALALMLSAGHES
ncbi:MAG: cytochrome b/b6 domain-containing protein [bacterium]|jgi:hypothetical protein